MIDVFRMSGQDWFVKAVKDYTVTLNSGHMYISEIIWYLGFLFGLDSLLRNLWETLSMSGKTLSSFWLLEVQQSLV